MNTYNRFPIVLEKGCGMYVYDENGKEYLDFVAGIAVNSLGHGHEKLCNVIAEQAKNMIHCSNLYWTKPQIEFAEKLVADTCFEKVFFCNSGAEAIEGALKLSRKYRKEGKKEIITMLNSFHGRTYGAITATGQAHYQEGLDPLLPNISYVPFNDFDALAAAVTSDTCAIFIEPIQGEGGIRPANKEYLQKVRALCDEKDILLVFDEIQCGFGRTGYLFAYQYYDVAPDVLTIAKGTAGGVPIGVLLANKKTASVFKPGDHASTFGGNPLATAAANCVIDELKGGLLENVKVQGQYLTTKLQELMAKHEQIIDVRGCGLMQGIELTVPVAPIIAKCIDNGLLLLNSGAKILRFVPSFIVSKEDIDKAMGILDEALA